MLSIVIPAHNEEKRLGPTLQAYGEFFKDLKDKKGLDCEILVVNNNSQDNTLGVIQEYAKKFPEIRYLDLEQGGKGYAVLEGMKSALGDYIGFVDADMATSPSNFYDLYANIGDYHGVIGGRWMKGSKVDRTFGKYIRSKGFNYLVRSLFLFPYRDTQCGAKIFRRDAIHKIIDEMISLKWAFDVNILYLLRKHGYRIKEHPTEWEDKEGSGISPKVPLQMAAGMIRLRLIYSPFTFIVRFYDKLPERVKVHH